MLSQLADDTTRVQVTDYSLRYGKSNCTWASCKEVTSIVTVTVPDLTSPPHCSGLHRRDLQVSPDPRHLRAQAALHRVQGRRGLRGV